MAIRPMNTGIAVYYTWLYIQVLFIHTSVCYYVIHPTEEEASRSRRLKYAKYNLISYVYLAPLPSLAIRPWLTLMLHINMQAPQ